jgi:hypothetical protein
VTVGRLVGLA